MKEIFEGDKRVTKKVLKAYDMALARFAQRPDVTGVDVGFKYCGGRRLARVVIRIHVREKFLKAHLSKRERIPATINGVATDVIQATYVDAACFEPARATALDPFQPGVSIGRADGGTGTIGLIVIDNVTGDESILSCRHILAAGSSPRPGDPILQPGPADGGTAANQVAALTRVDTPTDSAIARLTKQRAHTPAQFGSGVTVSGSRYPRLGDVLEKSSRTTGVQRGVVDGIGAFEGLKFSFHIVPAGAEGACQISEPGDSGSVWYDPGTKKAVGLHAKGEPSGSGLQDYAIATSAKKIAVLLNIKV
ncbi:MAG TPA: hypothetical protein VFT13_08970 [Candidatus Krumholzibacteria bacterium]|nr:hypothetical protein [Candidatus Krumholzibacteria bacterium]